MGLYAERPNRLIIPRWRDFNRTTKSKELNSLKPNQNPDRFRSSIQQKLDSWRSNKTLFEAISLVNSAFVSGLSELAIEPAKYIQQHKELAQEPILDLSKRIINSDFKKGDKLDTQPELDNLGAIIGHKIKEARFKLKAFPRNPVLWVELSRLYLIIGKNPDAKKCIITAVQLAPHNRYVTRSAIRLFFHLDSDRYADKAKNILNNNKYSSHDPWLLSSHIALDSYLERYQTKIKRGIELIESKNLSPFDLTELRSAIATEELRNGSNKSSRDIFNKSLIDPNENSVAQADWASGHLDYLDINYNVDNAHEANAYKNLKEEKWEKAYQDACNWYLDQPFSTQPARLGSYIAGSLLDDNLKSIEVCNFGLRANPHDFTLLNNKAYSLAVENKVKEASITFEKINKSNLNDSSTVVYNATKGMIKYREGNPEKGEYYYDKATELANKLNDKKLVGHAKLYKTRAELLTNNSSGNRKNTVAKLKKELEAVFDTKLKKQFDNLKERVLAPK